MPKQFMEFNFHNVEVVRASGYIEMANLVLEGKAEAAVYDETALEWLEAQSSCFKKLEVTGVQFGPQEYGYAFPKGSVLREAVSEAVTYLRTSRHPDIDYELRRKWFPNKDSCSGSEEGAKTQQLTFEEFGEIFKVIFLAVGIIFMLWAAQGWAFAMFSSRRTMRYICARGTQKIEV